MFESTDETLVCDHSNESYWAAPGMDMSEIEEGAEEVCPHEHIQ